MEKSWYARIDGSPEDIAAFKATFADFSFDEIDGKCALASPEFEAFAAGDTGAVIAAARKLLSDANAALGFSDPHFRGLNLLGIVEKRGAAMHRTRIGDTLHFELRPGYLTAVASGAKPTRSREERLFSLMKRNPDLAKIIERLWIRPVPLNTLRSAYETICGLMSSKHYPGEKRDDHDAIINKRWLTKDEHERFRRAANPDSHGYPRDNRNLPAMSDDEACDLVKRLVWRLVDEQEPA